MRLSGLSLAALLFLSSFLIAQHSSGAGSSSSSSSSSSSGGGSHSSSAASSGSSGGGHSSSAGSSSSGGSHAAGGDHSSSGGHSSTGGSGPAHSSTTASPAHGTAARGKAEPTSTIVSPSRNPGNSSSSLARPVRGPKQALGGSESIAPKRGFFSVLFHPFRKAPRPQPKPALYLPRPICPRGHCAPPCPIGQVHSGGACTAPVVPLCRPGHIWKGINCGYAHDQCLPGAAWDGFSCTYGTQFLDNCLGLRTALQRQEERVRAAASIRQSACGNGPSQDCSQATAAWQSEESLRQNLLSRYRRCQTRSWAGNSAAYGPFYDQTLWFDSLRFDVDY